MGGLGLTLRALEARVGRLSLDRYHGLYEHCPLLAVCFLVTGLASVGFPGALGFVAADLLIEGAVASNIFIGVGLVLATALNGIAILRAYFSLFTGARHVSNVSLAITWRERLVVLDPHHASRGKWCAGTTVGQFLLSRLTCSLRIDPCRVPRGSAY